MVEAIVPWLTGSIDFCFEKKGSKTKKRMKEEEIEKGDCAPPTGKYFFHILLRWTLVCEVIRYRLVHVRQKS